MDTDSIVAAFTRILSTPRDPEDQARQLAQWLTLEYVLTPRATMDLLLYGSAFTRVDADGTTHRIDPREVLFSTEARETK